MDTTADLPTLSLGAQRLDGIEREARILNHAANQSDECDNHSSGNQCSGSDQRRMSRFSVIGEGTVQGESSHREGDGVCQDHSKNAPM